MALAVPDEAQKDSPACNTTDKLSIVKTELAPIVKPNINAELAETVLTMEKFNVAFDAVVLVAIMLLIITDVDAGHVYKAEVPLVDNWTGIVPSRLGVQVAT